MTENVSKYKLKLRGGGSLVGCKPVFANDSSSSLLCGSGDQIKVFSNGECVRKLIGHEATVTSIVMNPNNSLQALTGSLDCSIIRWDWKYGDLLRRYKSEHPIYALYASSNDQLYGITGKDKKDCSLVQFLLGKKHTDAVKTKVLLENVYPKQDQCSVGCQGEYVVAIKHKKLLVYNTKTKETKKFKTGPHLLTCVECHPKEYCIATGCRDGAIVLWRNFLDEKRHLIKTTEHWHSLQVLSLAFSPEGSMLLSGGYECVLVKWFLPDLKKRDTLPRLGAPIVNLACSHDSTNFAVCYIDNGVQIIDNRFLIKHTFQGLVQGHFEQQMKQPIATGIHFDPSTGALVLNGRPGHIQFFDVKSEQQTFTLDIVGENYVSPDDLKRPLFMTEVENIAFDVNGDWLATIERRDDGLTAVTLQLKFWRYSKESQTFSLNTNIRLPHTRKVDTLKFRPNGFPMAVTSCPDGKFKMWVLVDSTDAYGHQSFWKCNSVGTYHDKIPGSADFDEDGSLLAVAFEDLLTYWDPEELQLVDVYPIPTKSIRNVTFGRKQNSMMLMFSTESTLYCWNVLHGHLKWTASLDVQTIVASPKDGNVVVFSKNNLLLYNPSRDSQPIFTYDVGQQEIVSAAFDMYSSKSSIETLYFITREQELLSLVLDGEEEMQADVEMAHFEQKIPLSKLRISVQKKLVTPASLSENTNTKKFIKEVVNVPVSFMPPLTTLCERYLEMFITSKKPERVDDSDEELDSETAAQGSSDAEESETEEDAELENDSEEEMDTEGVAEVGLSVQ